MREEYQRLDRRARRYMAWLMDADCDSDRRSYLSGACLAYEALNDLIAHRFDRVFGGCICAAETGLGWRYLEV